MKRLITALAFALTAGAAQAGEFRGQITYGIGEQTYKDSFDKISLSTGTAHIAARYFFAEKGFFLGLNKSQTTLGDPEINGVSFDSPDIDVDIAGYTLGYRFGHMGESQAFIAFSKRFQYDIEGEDAGTGGGEFLLGVEQATDSSRFDFGLSYSSFDEGDGSVEGFNFGGSGTFFLNEYLGLVLAANYFTGDDTSLGFATLDITSWSVNAGVEARF